MPAVVGLKAGARKTRPLLNDQKLKKSIRLLETKLITPRY